LERLWADAVYSGVAPGRCAAVNEARQPHWRPSDEQPQPVTELERAWVRARRLMDTITDTLAELERLGDEIRRHRQGRR
jgi:hypothetical protein